MGLLDFIGGRKSAATLDTSTGELRRNALAKAVEDARRGGQPQAKRHPASVKNTAARMMFASAEIGRLTGDWPTNPAAVDWIITRFQRTLVARSREQACNNDTMKAYLRLLRLNIIGPTGIAFHSQIMTRDGKPDHKARAAVRRWFKKWSRPENCDITGKASWVAQQRQALNTCATDGEAFARIIVGADAGPMGCALQWIDPQRCPVDMNRNDLPNGAFIRHGIKFNRYGRPLSYFFANDVRDGTQAYSYTGTGYEEVPASEVIHLFDPEFVGQKRGLPWASTGLYRAKHVQAGEDAAVVNMRMGAAKMGFIQFEDGHGVELDEDEDLMIDAEPGAFPVLPEGAKLEKFDPLYPTGELVPFVKLMNRQFAAGGGVSYHALTQDLTDVNFSSIRQGELDARESYKERQEIFIEQLCERVFSVLFPRALLARQVVDEDGVPLQASRLEAYSAHTWQPRRWSWIDPRADVDAAESWKNNLMNSPSALIREEGMDPHDVWTETAGDIKAMQEAGIPMEVILTSFGHQPKPPQPNAPKGETKQ